MPDGHIVLVKRAIEPGFGQWVFPGGYVDRGEEVREAALREAREEAGVEIRLGDLVGVYSYTGSLPVVIVYAATWLAGELAVDDENSEIRTFSATEVPWDELAFRSTREALRDYLTAIDRVIG
jgi:ADP-ribose pyrophosphatase YjhB (NUDIX family)